MNTRGPVNVGEGVDATLLAQLGQNTDNRKAGGIATFAVSFAPESRLEIPGPDEDAPDVALYGVTEGVLEITLIEGTGFYYSPSESDQTEQADQSDQSEIVEKPMEVGVPVLVAAGGYASLQSKHHVSNAGDGHGAATAATQGGRCKMCPGRTP